VLSSLLLLNGPATTYIYALSLHDALPIYKDGFADVDEFGQFVSSNGSPPPAPFPELDAPDTPSRDSFGRALTGMGGTALYDTIEIEEHTSELQSPYDLVCRLLLEKKKGKQ